MHDRPGTATGAGTESRDSTLAEGRAALDEVTRNTLVRKKGTPFLSCLPGEGIGLLDMLAYCGRRIHNEGMIKLKYGNTNTFYIPGGSGGSAGKRGGLLIDTDYAGTLPMFFKAIKAAGIGTGDISHLLATHYHPDHAGIAGELQRLGVRPVIVDVQLEHVHFADEIFEREKRLTDRGPGYTAIDEGEAVVITCEESRSFLESIGIAGEIIHTPSHSEDSVSVVLDDGDCFVGDLEPFEYLAAYGENPALQSDWDKVMSMGPKRVFYGHANEKFFEG